MELEIDEILARAEPMGDGLSNDVMATEEFVIKRYRKYPFTSFYTSFLEIFDFRVNYVNREQRMENEQEMVERVRDAGLEAPRIIEVGDDFIVFEKIEGTDGFRFMEQASEKEAVWLGSVLREFLDDLHSGGAAIRDCRVSNYIISDGEVYSIDHEYSGTNAHLFFRFLDEATLLGSIRQTPGYSGFVEGFQPSLPASIASFFLALDHVILFDREKERLVNLMRSLAG